MKRRKAFVREERLIQIVNKYHDIYKDDMFAQVTASEVGHWLDVSATQSRSLLGSLVTQGVMVETREPYPGVCGYRTLFQFSNEYVIECQRKVFSAEKPKARTVKINGKQIAMEYQQ